MKISSVEKLTWALIYGGLLTAVFGLAVQAETPWIGHTLLIVGGLVAIAGFGLIYVRSRMKD